MIEFAGFIMPVKYTSIEEEHNNVRFNAGIFDISHMGLLKIEGRDSIRFVNHALSNLIHKISYKMTYAFLLNENGYPLDDLMVYYVSEELIYIVCNASNKRRDFATLLELKKGFDVDISNLFDDYGGLAIQGKNACNYIKDIVNVDISALKFMNFMVVEDLIISRSGYTGEDGFEIYDLNENIINYFVKAIKLGIPPIGLGARDTLRFEANLPLYGHEISEEISPVEAGLTYGYNLEKFEFIGKHGLYQKSLHKTRHIVGIELLEKAVPRAQYKVFDLDDKEIGFVTTGYLLPGRKPLALALVDINYRKIGTPVKVLIRDKYYNAVVRDKKFMTKEYVK